MTPAIALAEPMSDNSLGRPPTSMFISDLLFDTIGPVFPSLNDDTIPKFKNKMVIYNIIVTYPCIGAIKAISFCELAELLRSRGNLSLLNHTSSLCATKHCVNSMGQGKVY